VINLISIELYKIFAAPRSYIGFLAIFVIVGAVQLAMFFEGEEIVSIAIQNLQQDFNLEGKLINCYLLTYILFNSLIFQIPILVCLISGDLIAGEANSGTLRLILIRAYSRSHIYIAKCLSGFFYVILLMSFFGLLSYVLGFFLFGTGDLVVLRRGVTVLSENDLIWRFICAFSFGTLSMFLVSSLCLMISAFSKNSIVPIVGTIAIIIVCNIILTLGGPIFKSIIPFFFTSHFTKWQYFFEFELDSVLILKSILIQILYIFLFNFIGLWHFKKKDILD